MAIPGPPYHGDAVLALLAYLNDDHATAGHHLRRHPTESLIKIAAAAVQLSVLALQIAVQLGSNGGNGRGPQA